MTKRKAKRPAAASNPVRASISFPPDQYAEIERIATAKKVSVAWVVREAIDGYLGAQWPLLASKGT